MLWRSSRYQVWICFIIFILEKNKNNFCFLFWRVLWLWFADWLLGCVLVFGVGWWMISVFAIHRLPFMQMLLFSGFGLIKTFVNHFVCRSWRTGNEVELFDAKFSIKGITYSRKVTHQVLTSKCEFERNFTTMWYPFWEDTGIEMCCLKVRSYWRPRQLNHGTICDGNV